MALIKIFDTTVPSATSTVSITGLSLPPGEMYQLHFDCWRDSGSGEGNVRLRVNGDVDETGNTSEYVFVFGTSFIGRRYASASGGKISDVAALNRIRLGIDAKGHLRSEGETYRFAASSISFFNTAGVRDKTVLTLITQLDLVCTTAGAIFAAGSRIWLYREE